MFGGGFADWNQMANAPFAGDSKFAGAVYCINTRLLNTSYSKMQIAVGHNHSRMYIRSYYYGSWSTWTAIPTKTDYLASAGYNPSGSGRISIGYYKYGQLVSLYTKITNFNITGLNTIVSDGLPLHLSYTTTNPNFQFMVTAFPYGGTFIRKTAILTLTGSTNYPGKGLLMASVFDNDGTVLTGNFSIDTSPVIYLTQEIALQ